MYKKFQQLNLFRLPPKFRGRSGFIVQIWWLVQSTLFSWSPQFLYSWRRFLLRIFGAKIGKMVQIRPTARVTYPWKLIIGDYSWIGDNVELYTLGNIQIGSHVVISQRSYLCTGEHDFTSLSFEISAEPIIIENQVWLATDVFIAPGVRVGCGSVIGARSSVFKDISGGKICYGNPAVPIRDRVIKNGE